MRQEQKPLIDGGKRERKFTKRAIVFRLQGCKSLLITVYSFAILVQAIQGCHSIEEWRYVENKTKENFVGHF